MILSGEFCFLLPVIGADPAQRHLSRGMVVGMVDVKSRFHLTETASHLRNLSNQVSYYSMMSSSMVISFSCKMAL